MKKVPITHVSSLPITASAHDFMDMRRISEYTGLSYWYIRALACGACKTSIRFPKERFIVSRRRIYMRDDIVHWWSRHEASRKRTPRSE